MKKILIGFAFLGLFSSCNKTPDFKNEIDSIRILADSSFAQIQVIREENIFLKNLIVQSVSQFDKINASVELANQNSGFALKVAQNVDKSTFEKISDLKQEIEAVKDLNNQLKILVGSNRIEVQKIERGVNTANSKIESLFNQVVELQFGFNYVDSLNTRIEAVEKRFEKCLCY